MKLDLQLDPRAVVQPPVSFLMIFIDKGAGFFFMRRATKYCSKCKEKSPSGKNKNRLWHKIL